jgi:single-strand DNA-binding protein
MSDIITLTGVVATIPRAITTSEGLAITSFRLASTQRRFDRAQEKWVDGDTNWYTVTTFRQLAANAAVSVKKGERVVVTGRLRIRDWESGDKAGTNIDVEAEAIGHDLSWGTAAFSRNTVSAPLDAHGGSEGSEGPATFPTDAAPAAISADAPVVDDSADGSAEGEAPTDRPAVLVGVGAENVTPF